jgi:hypothetical protein
MYAIPKSFARGAQQCLIMIDLLVATWAHDNATHAERRESLAAVEAATRPWMGVPEVAERLAEIRRDVESGAVSDGPIAIRGDRFVAVV